MPVFAHLEGISHVYVDRAADLEMAKSIVLNAKMRRTGVCGAAETLLVDRAGAPTTLQPLVDDADRRRLRGARRRRRAARRSRREAGRRRGLGHRISRRDHVGESRRRRRRARSRISHDYGSHHTDAIVTEDAATAAQLSQRGRLAPSCCTTPRPSSPTAASSASAPKSASPPGKLHARGPVGAEQLTSFKYRVRGTGQTRP